jgi:hypothetical protein
MILCAVCGAPVRPPFEPPAAELSPDLDFRQGEPARSTLKRWIAECSGCGAAAPDLTALSTESGEVVRSDPEYAAIRSQAPAFARPFLLWALICQRAGKQWGAAEALLQAAWSADDADEAEWAVAWRGQAASLWPDSKEIRPRLCLIDIYRRAKDFPNAAAVVESLAASELDDSSAAIVDFQRRLVAARETGRQLLSSALRPPASRPHVSYKQKMAPRPGGFWHRLMGRG